MTSSLIPSTPIVPTPKTWRRCTQYRTHIRSQRERMKDSQRFGSFHSGGFINADWHIVDRKNGDLLYVGESISLINRLYPTNHAMWSVVWRRPERKNVRIAIWFMPVHQIGNVAAWMTNTFTPLWNGGPEVRFDTWRFRDPDLVLPTDDFHPHRRTRAPFDRSNAGVYAWLLTPSDGICDVASICFDRTRIDRIR